MEGGTAAARPREAKPSGRPDGAAATHRFLTELAAVPPPPVLDGQLSLEDEGEPGDA